MMYAMFYSQIDRKIVAGLIVSETKDFVEIAADHATYKIPPSQVLARAEHKE